MMKIRLEVGVTNNNLLMFEDKVKRLRKIWDERYKDVTSVVRVELADSSGTNFLLILESEGEIE